MSSKTTYRFAQYRTDQIAKCVSGLAEHGGFASFDTSGNLSGRYQEDRRTNAVRQWRGWEGHHPEWAERLDYYEGQGASTHDIVYVVYSFATVVGILVKHKHSGEFHWEVDKAAPHHSAFTSKAFSSFMAAINAPGFWTWHAQSLGSMQSVAPESVRIVYQIGEAWLAAQHLSPTQRRALTSERGMPQREATLAAMRRYGVIDERGFMTDLGLRAARFCVERAS